MSLDLGVLVGHVLLETREFDVGYVRLVRQFADLGAKAVASSAGTGELDASLRAAAVAGNTAVSGLGRAREAMTGAGLSASEAAVAVSAYRGSLSEAELAASRLTQAQLRLAAASDRLVVLQASETATARQLATAQAAVMAASDRTAIAQERLGAATTFTTRFGEAWRAIPGPVKAAAAVVAAATAGIVYESLKMASSFQTATTRIHTQANATVRQTRALSAGFLRLAGVVATMPDDLADAGFHIASVGQKSLTTAQELRVLRIAAEGAKLGGANLVDVTNALDAAIVSGIHGVKNYSQAMGVLNATVGAGDMQMQDLADAFGPLGAVLKGYNVSIQQAGAALATFGDNNLRGAHAGTSLRMAVQALAVPVRAGADLLQNWGIKTGNLTKQLQHGGLTEALDTLMHLMRKNGITAKEQGDILTQAFGKKAGIGLSVLLGQLERYHTKLDEVTRGGSRFASSWTGYTRTFGYAVDAAKAAAESLGVQLGTKLLPIATKAMRWLATSGMNYVRQFGDEIRRLWPIVEPSFRQIAHFVTAELGPSLRNLGPIARQVAKAMGTQLVIALKIVATLLDRDVGPALLAVTGYLHRHAAAVRVVVSVLTAMLTPLAAAAHAFQTVGHAASAFGAAVHDGVDHAIAIVRSLPGRIVAAVGDLSTLLVHAGEQVIGGLASGILHGATSTLTGVLHKVTSLIPLHKGPPAKDRRLLFDSGRLITQGLVDGIHSGLGALETELTGISDRIKTRIANTQNQLQAVRGNAASLSSSVSSGLSGAFDLSNASNLSVKGLTSFLSYGARASEQFDVIERRLINRHLSPALAQQLASLAANDPMAAITLGRNILRSGPAGIGRLDRLERRIDRANTRTGEALSNQQYGAGIRRLEHSLSGLQRSLDSIRSEIASVKHEMRLEQHKANVRGGGR